MSKRDGGGGEGGGRERERQGGRERVDSGMFLEIRPKPVCLVTTLHGFSKIKMIFFNYQLVAVPSTIYSMATHTIRAVAAAISVLTAA